MAIKDPIETLSLRAITIQRRRFETLLPVTFPVLRNQEKAPKRIRGTADLYQQDIEPAGLYLVFDDSPKRPKPSTWKQGTASFRAPLVIGFGPNGYDERSWKARLSRAYGGKKGAALSRAMLASGIDGIVTVDDRDEIAEIVALRPMVSVVLA